MSSIHYITIITTLTLLWVYVSMIMAARHRFKTYGIVYTKRQLVIFPVYLIYLMMFWLKNATNDLPFQIKRKLFVLVIMAFPVCATLVCGHVQLAHQK